MMANYINKWRLVALCFFVLFAMPVHAELVVIVNTGVKVDKLSRDEVVNIFMGRYRKLSDGSSAQPLDIRDESLERQNFYKKLLDKSLAEINAYWARLIFSGRTTPPVVMDTQHDIIDKVSHDLGAIGYVERGNLSSKVKIVYSLPE